MIKLSQVDELANRVRTRLQKEQMDSGAFFMTEAQLADEYQVSRKVVREAIGKLQALGVVESRKRKGIVVGKPDPVQLLAVSIPSLASSPEELIELARLRYALEIGSIELSVRNATDVQIAKLSEVESEMEKVFRSGNSPKREIELDISYHSLILEMTGSRMISGMQRILVEFFHAAQQNRPPHRRVDAERIIVEHRFLLQSIRNRDAEGARALLRIQLQWLLDVDSLKRRGQPQSKREKK